MKTFVVKAYYSAERGAHDYSNEWIAGVATSLDEAKGIEKKALDFLRKEYKDELDDSEQNDGVDNLYKDRFYIGAYINEVEVGKFYNEKEANKLKSL